MDDAEKLRRALDGEYVGSVTTLAPVLCGEIRRLRAERDSLLDVVKGFIFALERHHAIYGVPSAFAEPYRDAKAAVVDTTFDPPPHSPS
jgi:hypothetical protein